MLMNKLNYILEKFKKSYNFDNYIKIVFRGKIHCFFDKLELSYTFILV